MTEADTPIAPRRANQAGDAPALPISAPPVPALSVVVPVHDEAGNLAFLISEIEAALAGRTSFEIVYVDDGSADGSAAELAGLRRGNPRLRVLRHRDRSGQSAALWTGVAAALAAWVATLDGDGQNDPADIPALLDARDSSATAKLWMVAGVRRKRRDSTVKRLSSRIANAVRRRVLRDAATDTGCGLKLFRRDAYLALPFFDHMHRFLPALIRRAGGAIIEVPVNHRPRAAGASHYGLWGRAWVGLFDMLGVAWLQWRAKNPIVEEMDE